MQSCKQDSDLLWILTLRCPNEASKSLKCPRGAPSFAQEILDNKDKIRKTTCREYNVRENGHLNHMFKKRQKCGSINLSQIEFETNLRAHPNSCKAEDGKKLLMRERMFDTAPYKHQKISKNFPDFLPQLPPGIDKVKTMSTTNSNYDDKILMRTYKKLNVGGEHSFDKSQGKAVSASFNKEDFTSTGRMKTRQIDRSFSNILRTTSGLRNCSNEDDFYEDKLKRPYGDVKPIMEPGMGIDTLKWQLNLRTWKKDKINKNSEK